MFQGSSWDITSEALSHRPMEQVKNLRHILYIFMQKA